MRIAIASEGNDINSIISSQGGRAPFYLIFDGKKLVESIKNPFAVGGGGAGWSVAKILADKGVDVVILSSIGPNMVSALKERNIKVEIKTGKVSDIIDNNDY